MKVPVRPTPAEQWHTVQCRWPVAVAGGDGHRRWAIPRACPPRPFVLRRPLGDRWVGACTHATAQPRVIRAVAPCAPRRHRRTDPQHAKRNHTHPTYISTFCVAELRGGVRPARPRTYTSAGHAAQRVPAHANVASATRIVTRTISDTAVDAVEHHRVRMPTYASRPAASMARSDSCGHSLTHCRKASSRSPGSVLAALLLAVHTASQGVGRGRLFVALHDAAVLTH